MSLKVGDPVFHRDVKIHMLVEGFSSDGKMVKAVSTHPDFNEKWIVDRSLLIPKFNVATIEIKVLDMDPVKNLMSSLAENFDSLPDAVKLAISGLRVES